MHRSPVIDFAQASRLLLCGMTALDRLASARQVGRKMWYKTKVFAFDGILRPLRTMDMQRLGSYYGGWWLPLIAPEEGVAICVGAGVDVTFDLELQRLGYEVVTVDPTPTAVEYVERAAPSLRLVPVGVWDHDGTIAFRQDGTHSDLWFAENTPWYGDEKTATGTPCDRTSTFPVVTMRTLLRRLGEPQIGILKLDVEGAEHRVIRSLLADGIQPRTLCVEFDDGAAQKVLATTKLLRAHGFVLYQIENMNFTFRLAHSL
jgi:FkbM family methyltransferase